MKRCLGITALIGLGVFLVGFALPHGGEAAQVVGAFLAIAVGGTAILMVEAHRM